METNQRMDISKNSKQTEKAKLNEQSLNFKCDTGVTLGKIYKKRTIFKKQTPRVFDMTHPMVIRSKCKD